MITLRPFQEKILSELRIWDGIGIFSKTGSGKTFMGIFRFLEDPTENLLVVCPPHVVGQWYENISLVAPELTQHIYPKSMTNKQKNLEIEAMMAPKPKGQVLVVSLSSLHSLTSIAKNIDENWTVIIDESHRIKDVGTARNPIKITAEALRIGAKTRYKVIMTATPTQKNYGGYIDLHSQLVFIGALKMSRRDFIDRYCYIKEVVVRGLPYPIKEIDGYRKNILEIEALLSLVTRSYSPQYTLEKPEHIKVDLHRPNSYVKLVKERLYEDILLESPTSFRIALKTLTGGTVMGRDEFDGRLLYEDNTIKQDWLTAFLSDQEDRVFVLYQYNVEREQIIKACERAKLTYIILDGENQDKRGDVLREDYDVIIGQISACGESLDGLQHRTHICVYYAMPESSTDYVQTKGRIDRDGQTTAPVYYYLSMKNTIDEKIYEMTQEKVEYSSITLDNIAITL